MNKIASKATKTGTVISQNLTSAEEPMLNKAGSITYNQTAQPSRLQPQLYKQEESLHLSFDLFTNFHHLNEITYFLSVDSTSAY